MSSPSLVTTQSSQVDPVKPVFNFAAARTADIDAYNHWKATGDKTSLGLLVKQLYPVIYSQVERVSGTLPKAALSAEAKKWAVKSIQTFNPDMGVALSTHCTNYLAKIRRMNYKYANNARLPENLHLQFSNYSSALAKLEESTGREPTDKEMSKELGWSEPLVMRFKKSLYSDLTESASQRPSEITQFNSNKFLMDHLMAQLNPEEKFLLIEAPNMSATEAAAKLSVNISRYNYLKSKLRDKILAIKSEIKFY